MQKITQLSRAISLALVASAMALPLSAAETKEGAEEVERIEVTGSRIKRTDSEGPSPIIVITFDDMKKSGAVTVSDALRNLTQNTGTVQGNEQSNTFTPNAEVNDLRGFGPGYTLTLINGRRLANYPAAYNASNSVVNTGAIPAVAVDRIEILTTGASAIYGSDAVAGVINIILKKDIDETTINALIGDPTEGPGNTYRLQVVTGTTFDKGNITAAIEYQKREIIKGGDRDWLDSAEDYPSGDGYLPRGILTMDYWNLYGWNASAEGPADEGYRDPGAARCDQGVPGMKYSSRPNRGNYCGIDDYSSATLRNESEKFSVFVNANYELTDNIGFSTDILFFDQSAANDGGALWVSEDILDTSTVRDTAFGPQYDWYLEQRYISGEELGGQGSATTYDESAWSAVFSLEGSLGENYNWTATYSDSRYTYESNTTLLKEEVVKEMILGDSLGIGFFGDEWYAGNGTHSDIYQPFSADEISQLTGTGINTGDTETQMLSFSIAGLLYEMDHGDIEFAAVVEHVRESYSLEADDRLLDDTGNGWYNRTGFEGGGKRNRSAIGVELSIPVTEDLLLGLAGRYDRYDSESSNIGGAFTPQITLSYRPTDDLLLRGTWSESFKAPDMHYIFTDTGYYQGSYDLSNCYETYVNNEGSDAGFDTGDCDSASFFHNRKGSKELKDERGTSLGLGLVWSPTEDLSVTLDYYDLEINDQVVTESTSQLLRDEYECNYGDGDVSADRCAYTKERIIRNTDPTTGVSSIQLINASPVNRASYRQKGIDANVKFGFETPIGGFDVNLGYTHTLGTQRQSQAGDEVEELRDSMYNWQPRSKVNGTVTYTYSDDLAVSLSGTRTGSVPVWDPSRVDEPTRVHPFMKYNLSSRYYVDAKTSVRLSVNNLFDNRPNVDDTFAAYEWPWYDASVYPGIGVGREVYLELQHTF